MRLCTEYSVVPSPILCTAWRQVNGWYEWVVPRHSREIECLTMFFKLYDSAGVRNSETAILAQALLAYKVSAAIVGPHELIRKSWSTDGSRALSGICLRQAQPRLRAFGKSCRDDKNTVLFHLTLRSIDDMELSITA